MTSDEFEVSVQLIRPSDTIRLRSAILRPGQPVEACHYDGDDEETAFHVGGFVSERLVSIATLFRRDDERCGFQPAFQLRGMATDESFQRRGIGAQVLAFSEAEVVRRDAVAIWCNGRVNAIPFYTSQGYTVVGGEFDVPNIGPHVICRKRLVIT